MSWTSQSVPTLHVPTLHVAAAIAPSVLLMSHAQRKLHLCILLLQPSQHAQLSHEQEINTERKSCSKIGLTQHCQHHSSQTQGAGGWRGSSASSAPSPRRCGAASAARCTAATTPSTTSTRTPAAASPSPWRGWRAWAACCSPPRTSRPGTRSSARRRWWWGPAGGCRQVSRAFLHILHSNPFHLPRP